MSQHPHPVGPTNNIAANFSPEMVIGSTPQRSRNAQQLAPAPDRDIQVAPPDVNPFSVEMAVGYHPDRPNLAKPFGVGQQIDTAEQVAAPFQNSMIEASRPVKSGVMRPLLFPAEKDWQVQPPEVPVFSIEMVKGWLPDRPVLFLPLRTGQQITQSQHLAAPFSVEMTLADRPTRSGVMRPLLVSAEKDYQVAPPDVQIVIVEQAQGYHPDSPRLFTARNSLGWIVSQTTPVQAAFTPDMIQGSAPSRNREFLPLRTGSRLWVSDIVVFSPDMTQGYHPDRPVLARGNQTGSSVVPVPIEFFVEMVRGYHPDRPVLMKGAQSSSILPPDVPVFSIEMVQGYHPDRPVLMRGNYSTQFVPPDSVGFANETVIGYHPDSPRLFLPLRTGRTLIDAAIHAAAAFGIEMVAGNHPDKNRVLFSTRNHIEVVVYAIPSNIVIPLVIRMTADGFSVSTMNGDTFSFSSFTTETWLGSN